MRTLSREDIENILLGCTLLGTGGGGSYQMGMKRISADFENGKEFRMIGLEELGDDELIASPYFCGSLVALLKAEESGNQLAQDTTAFSALQEYCREPFAAAISTELGGFNTASALSVAANMGIPFVDADPAGRAVPELQHSTFYLDGISITPMAVASSTDTLIIVKALADPRAEAIVRSVALLNDGFAGVADHPVRGSELKASVISGALSYAEKLGKAIRTNDCRKVATAGNGYVLFKGVVSRSDFEERDGFTWGTVAIEDRDAGSAYEVVYKNENYVSYRNGEIDVTVPDLICIACSDTAEPITHPNCQQGDKVTVLGFPSPEKWRTERGMAALGPAHYNIECDYLPIEEKHG